MPVPPGYIHHLGHRGEIFYRRNVGSVSGPPLLLLHGWSASADLQWITSYDDLADLPYLAVDHHGHGRGVRTTEPFTLEACADDAAQLVRDLGIGPVILVGYSMGGPVSLLFAHRHPDLVAGIVVAATALEWRSTRSDRVRWKFLWLTDMAVRSRFAPWGARQVLDRSVAQNPTLAAHRPRLEAEVRRLDRIAFIEAGKALSRYDARPFASFIGRPAAIVLTTKDRLVRPRKQRALGTALGASVHPIDGDHLVFWDDGPAFARSLRSAIDDVRAQIYSAVV